MTDLDLRVRVLLAMQVVLLGTVTENLSAVTCRWDSSSIHVRAMFGSDKSDLDEETMDDVEAELISHFPDKDVKVECLRHDPASRLTAEPEEIFVFRRQEEFSS